MFLRAALLIVNAQTICEDVTVFIRQLGEVTNGTLAHALTGNTL